MFKALLMIVLVFAGIRFVKNILLMQKSQSKKDKTNYQEMDIQDAEYKEINND